MGELLFETFNLLIGSVRTFGPGPTYLVKGLPRDPSLIGTHLLISVLGEDEEFDYPIAHIETDPLAR
jgi:hypothetical protein